MLLFLSLLGLCLTNFSVLCLRVTVRTVLPGFYYTSTPYYMCVLGELFRLFCDRFSPNSPCVYLSLPSFLFTSTHSLLHNRHWNSFTIICYPLKSIESSPFLFSVGVPSLAPFLLLPTPLDDHSHNQGFFHFSVHTTFYFLYSKSSLNV